MNQNQKRMCFMNANYLKVFFAVTAAVLLTGMPVHAIEIVQANIRPVSGEITWIDLKLGKLQLERDMSPRTEEITEYRINKNETRVVSPTDKKFLTVEDLYPGQHVAIDVVNGKEGDIVQKITAE